MSVKWIKRSIVESPYCIGLCRKEKDFYKELKRLKIPKAEWPKWIRNNYSATTYFFESSDAHDHCCIVCIGKRKGRGIVAAYGLLIHEAVHIWQHICKDLNEHHPSSEFEAYSIQMISQCLIAAYLNNKK